MTDTPKTTATSEGKRVLRSALLWRMVGVDLLRLAGALGGGVALASLLAPRLGAALALTTAVIWIGALYFGGKWRDFWRFHRIGPAPISRQGPSWTIGFWLATFAAGLAVAMFGFARPPILAVDLFGALGAATNLAYAGAKAGCAAIGCCRSHSSLRKFVGASHPAVWRSLAAAEAAVSLGAGLLACLLASISPGIVGGLALGAHGSIRLGEYFLRMPYRRLERQLTDLASAGILWLSLLVTGLLFAARSL